MVKKILKITMIALVILVLLAGVVIFFHTNSVLKNMADGIVVTSGNLVEQYKDEIESIEVENSDGLKIAGWHFDISNPKGVVVILHGMHGMDAASLLHYGKFFKEEGYTSICLDMRAHGRSEGDRLSFGYEEVKDVSAILDWADDKYDDIPVILYGLSMGGATAIRTAAAREDVDMVISISSYDKLESQMRDFMKSMDLPDAVVESYIPFFKLHLAIRHKVNTSKTSPIRDISKISTRPILLVHGDEDEQTLVRQAYSLKNKAGDNVKLRIVEGAKHLVIDENILAEENEWFRDEIIDFINANL
ncbi:MAG: alpha/beta fold hydrolase [Halanaerobiales bacterium]|nr:alpha/beta fold hydrolase [Halanaerobiales bacterium]